MTLLRVCSYKLIFLLVAVNYFAFRVELFEDEYTHNHPDNPDTCSFTNPTLTWESYDKDNATEAFVFDPGLRIEWLQSVPSECPLQFVDHRQYQPVRDKSPPA